MGFLFIRLKYKVSLISVRKDEFLRYQLEKNVFLGYNLGLNVFLAYLVQEDEFLWKEMGSSISVR